MSLLSDVGLLSFIIFLVLLPVNTSALTTFGKTSPQNQNPPPPPTPVGKARECKTESDCNAIQNTTCVQDPNGDKKRCLCGDLSAPVNGYCSYQYKALHSMCNDDNDCGDGAECIPENTTSSVKKCTCKEDWIEENFKCNGSITFTSSLFLLIFSILIVKH
ncbi:uncharacterized protein LOC103572738 [Microplitis demolitor]|uniref:uncharacterized protein LOC103572738 n=1 Tax=Microplitis demolitor TaxID=69319 RepID=UPI0004CCD1F0|nr:uncharacterized protein LOC103572738 [Microplitis demolitor]